MGKHKYLVLTILALTLLLAPSVYSQEVISAEKPEQTKSADTTKPPTAKNTEAENVVAVADTQTTQTNSSSTSNNSTYVFPTSRERFNRYVKSTIGPFSLLRSAASAGIQQWDNSPVEWGQGMEGYGKRFGSSVGSNAIRQTVTYGLSEAFKLDTGFERSKHKKFWPRVGDALIQNITSRTRSGKRVLSAPILIGTYAGTIIPTETWYPERYNYKDGLRGGSYTLLMGFGVNLVKEFIFKW